MKEYVRTIDGLPLIIKLILALPMIDGIIYGIYRIAKGKVLIGVLWIFFGACVLWVIDLISILLKGKVIFLV